MGNKNSGNKPLVDKDEVEFRKWLLEHKGYLYPKTDWKKRGDEKIKKLGITDEVFDSEVQNKYKKWVVDLGIDDFEGMSNEEIEKLVYDYKGRKHLYKQGTKEEGFEGKYKQY